MKYVITWTNRPGGSGLDNEQTQKRLLAVFGKWSPSPSSTIHQFVARLDARGGFSIVETDDPTVIASDLALFSPYFDYTVHPVLDIQDIVPLSFAAIELRDSV